MHCCLCSIEVAGTFQRHANGIALSLLYFAFSPQLPLFSCIDDDFRLLPQPLFDDDSFDRWAHENGSCGRSFSLELLLIIHYEV